MTLVHDSDSARSSSLIYPRKGVAAYGFDMLTTGAGLCFVGALVTDYTYSRSPDIQWANFSAWLLLFAIVFSGLAGLFGLLVFITNRSREFSALRVLYVLSLIAIFALGMINNFVHSRDAWTSVVPLGLNFSIATVCAVILAAILHAAIPNSKDVRN